jgi:hypothetical protein
LRTKITDLIGRDVDYDLHNKSIGVNVDGLQTSNPWSLREKIMKANQEILNTQMNPHLINICYEKHLKGNLFRYTKKPHPCSWVYHADSNMETFIKGTNDTDENPGLGLGPGNPNPDTVISTNIPIMLNESSVNNSFNKIVLEVSTVDPDFSITDFKTCTRSTPYLAGVYESSIDCNNCDIPGINAKKGRCRVLLSEHFDTRLTDVDPKKIHPQTMLNLLGHVLYAVHVLHTKGYVHGGICSDAIGINYVDFAKIHHKTELDETFAHTDHTDWQDQYLVFTDEADKNSSAKEDQEKNNVYVMTNVLSAGTNEDGCGGIQLVLGGYNHVRKIKSSYCTTSDDVASVMLTFAKKFGSNFVHHFSRAEKYDPLRLTTQQLNAEVNDAARTTLIANKSKIRRKNDGWVGAPIVKHVGSHKNLLDITVEQISLAASNTPDGKNNEERIEHLQKQHSWTKMFTCAKEALIKFCGPVFFKLLVEGPYPPPPAAATLNAALPAFVTLLLGEDEKRNKKLGGCKSWAEDSTVIIPAEPANQITSFTNMLKNAEELNCLDFPAA